MSLEKRGWMLAHRLAPELFAFGWRRLTTKTIIMDSMMVGPWEVTLYRLTSEGEKLIRTSR